MVFHPIHALINRRVALKQQYVLSKFVEVEVDPQYRSFQFQTKYDELQSAVLEIFAEEERVQLRRGRVVRFE